MKPIRKIMQDRRERKERKRQASEAEASKMVALIERVPDKNWADFYFDFNFNPPYYNNFRNKYSWRFGGQTNDLTILLSYDLRFKGGIAVGVGVIYRNQFIYHRKFEKSRELQKAYEEVERKHSQTKKSAEAEEKEAIGRIVSQG